MIYAHDILRLAFYVTFAGILIIGMIECGAGDRIRAALGDIDETETAILQALIRIDTWANAARIYAEMERVGYRYERSTLGIAIVAIRLETVLVWAKMVERNGRDPFTSACRLTARGRAKAREANFKRAKRSRWHA
jgi:hypothetical protein